MTIQFDRILPFTAETRDKPVPMSKIQVFTFDSFPHRTLTMAFCKPEHDLSLKKDHVLSQGLIAINASLVFRLAL